MAPTILHPWREAKRARALAIRHYLLTAGRPRWVVCLSCGHAADALRDVGCAVVEIGDGPNANARTDAWWTPADVARRFPFHFDGTSGHLAPALVADAARVLHDILGPLEPADVDVPSGSGETVLMLSLAYPHLRLRAVYGEHGPGTEYAPEGRLNAVVRQVCARGVSTPPVLHLVHGTHAVRPRDAKGGDT